MFDPPILQFMTPSPHTIAHDQTLATAHRLMQEHKLRHLPVLERGKLVGIVSERDLYFVETLRGVELDSVQVSDAMSFDIFTVPPGASMREVAAEMAEHKYGSAVVVDAGQVVGVFTTTDALEALSELIDELKYEAEPAR
jgi:acetoin utilization protein AcuB